MSLLNLFIPKSRVSGILRHISSVRVCTIYGTVGFGKTAMAFDIAQKLIANGLADGCVSNVPHILPTGLYGDDGSLKRKVVVFDEAWQVVDSRTSMTNSNAYGGFARKFQCYWLFPTVNDIDKRLRSLVVRPKRRSMGGKRVWSLSIGYQGKEQHITDFVSFNENAYGLYSTGYVPSDDGGIEMRYAVSFYKSTRTPYNFKGDIERRLIQAKAGENEDTL